MLTSELVVLVSTYFNVVIFTNTSLIFFVCVLDGNNNNNNNNNIMKYAGITAQGHLQNKHEYIGAQIHSSVTQTKQNNE